MPWSPSEAAQKDSKVAGNPKLERQWAHIADGNLKRGMPEGQAIREANGVVLKEIIRHHDGEVKHR